MLEVDAEHLQAFPAEAFADVLEANRRYSERFTSAGLTGTAAKGLAVITCMDSRIDPLGVLGLRPGDVKIMRNAGARVTDDMLRTLILASHLLGDDRVLVMPHTDCKMTGTSEMAIHESILRSSGVDTRCIEFRTTTDQVKALASDVIRVRSHPLLPEGLSIGGAIYDVASGSLTTIDC
jgi:carbonic anhydrase